VSNVPTLHTIDVSSRLKLRIDARMRVYLRRQPGLAGAIEVPGKDCLGAMFPHVGFLRRGFGELLGLASVQVIQRLRHALSGQSAHIHCLCMFEKLVDIGRSDGVMGNLLFEPPETERRKHQQPGNAGHQQP